MAYTSLGHVFTGFPALSDAPSPACREEPPMSRPALTVLLGTALIAATLTAAEAQAVTPQPVAAALPQVAAPTTVTLITGDKVMLTPDPDGTKISMEAAVRPNG